MRKLIVTEFMSLDGVFESPGPEGNGYKYEGWTFAHASEDSMQFKHDELFEADALLLGKTTYEGFAKAWPNMQGAGDFGEKMNSIDKYVVSTTLQKTNWQNSHIISKDIVKAVQELKDKEGKDILVNGSGMLVTFLMKYDLVDQFNIMVYPVVLGTGKKLFADAPKVDLTLIESKPFASGVVLLKYTTKDTNIS